MGKITEKDIEKWEKKHKVEKLIKAMDDENEALRSMAVKALENVVVDIPPLLQPKRGNAAFISHKQGELAKALIALGRSQEAQDIAYQYMTDNTLGKDMPFVMSIHLEETGNLDGAIYWKQRALEREGGLAARSYLYQTITKLQKEKGDIIGAEQTLGEGIAFYHAAVDGKAGKDMEASAGFMATYVMSGGGADSETYKKSYIGSYRSVLEEMYVDIRKERLHDLWEAALELEGKGDMQSAMNKLDELALLVDESTPVDKKLKRTKKSFIKDISEARARMAGT
jgi:tetratricopeptide (TPR) repeat protein